MQGSQNYDRCLLSCLISPWDLFKQLIFLDLYYHQYDDKKTESKSQQSHDKILEDIYHFLGHMEIHDLNTILKVNVVKLKSV